MKRTGLLSLAMALAAFTANAQAGITMGAMNGWMFSFSGNVNAFLTYTDPSCGGGAATCGFDGNLIPVSDENKVTRIQTGLAPAFAIFEAKGKEGGMDLGVHFGFAPEIQTMGTVSGEGRAHDNCGSGSSCGSQIDMREVYLTVGGSWGQILAGRAIGVYQKQNLLTDLTVFGVGLTGGNPGNGTTLGHIGTGYTYPNFNAQITYSSAGNKEGQFTIGLFDPSIVTSNTGSSFTQTQLPRLEVEYTHTKKSSDGGKMMLYVSGLVANAKDVATSQSITPWGIAGGGEWTGGGGLQVDISGFYQSGVGSLLMFDDGLAIDGADSLRTSYGFLAQLQYMAKDSKWKFGGAYGMNHLNQTTNDKLLGTANTAMKDASDITLAATYMYTKSLRGVFELDFGNGSGYNDSKTSSTTVAAGMMLFF